MAERQTTRYKQLQITEQAFGWKYFLFIMWEGETK